MQELEVFEVAFLLARAAGLLPQRAQGGLDLAVELGAGKVVGGDKQRLIGQSGVVEPKGVAA